MSTFAGDDGSDRFVREETERFGRIRERAEGLRAELAQNTVTISDGQGVVTVTVGSGGVMQSIVFGPRATQSGPARLSEAVMRTYAQACRDAAERSQQIVGELVGADSPVLQLMRDAVPPDPGGEDDERGGG